MLALVALTGRKQLVATRRRALPKSQIAVNLNHILDPTFLQRAIHVRSCDKNALFAFNYAAKNVISLMRSCCLIAFCSVAKKRVKIVWSLLQRDRRTQIQIPWHLIEHSETRISRATGASEDDEQVRRRYRVMSARKRRRPFHDRTKSKKKKNRSQPFSSTSSKKKFLEEQTNRYRKKPKTQLKSMKSSVRNICVSLAIPFASETSKISFA
jgi:hypothetical protein